MAKNTTKISVVDGALTMKRGKRTVIVPFDNSSSLLSPKGRATVQVATLLAQGKVLVRDEP